MSSQLNSVKTTYSFTAEFAGNTTDPCFTKGILESSPSIYYSGNSLFFNYSQTKNVNDLKFLKIFFSGFTAGDTFAYSAGEYVNINTGEIKYWNGYLTFRGTTGLYNEYIICSGITNTTGISQGLYDYKLFEKPIQYTKTTGITGNFLISKTPENDPLNFLYLGAYGSDFNFEEYVEVENSILNNKRIKVKNCLKLNDNSELLYLDPTDTIVNENLYFQKSFINLYMRGTLNIETINSDEAINGVLYFYHSSQPGVYSHLLENQNKKQFNLRSVENPDIAKNWYPNTTIKNFNTGFSITDASYSYQFSKIYHLVYTTNIIYELKTSSLFGSPVTTVQGFSNTLLIDNLPTTFILHEQTSEQTAFKIDLSDSRNLNLQVKVFIDPEMTIPMSENYFIYGKPGTIGSCFVYYGESSQNQQSIYLKLERESINALTIIVS